MLFALICTDKTPDGLALRAENRPKHLDYLAELGDKVKAAGPFMSEDGAQPTGSLVVIDVEDMTAAQQIADNDPYALAGVFENVEIRPWKWLIGAPDGV